MKDDDMLLHKPLILASAFVVLTTLAACLPESASSQPPIRGVYCENSGGIDKTLAIHQAEGSTDLYVGLNYWFENGRACSFGGNAKPTGSGSWSILQKNESDGLTCELTLSTNPNGDITITQIEGGNCTDYCGSQMSFDTQTVLASSKTKPDITIDEIQRRGELNLCPK
jgi:hypothetical protein